MGLKLSLKPGEKFVLNGAVIVNGKKPADVLLQNHAALLRERDILQPEEADTPAKRIYFAIMMLYLEPASVDTYYSQFAARMSEFMGAIINPQIQHSCAAISEHVNAGDYYKALAICKTLFEYERERLNYDPASV